MPLQRCGSLLASGVGGQLGGLGVRVLRHKSQGQSRIEKVFVNLSVINVS